MNDFMIKISRRIFGDDYFKETQHITDPDKPIYYIIRRVPFGEGFFSNYFYVLSHVIYACKKGWRPVVDMEHYKTLYHDRNSKGNLWEKYFEPMNGITLVQAYRSENYVLSSGKYLAEMGVPVYEINQGYIADEMIRDLQHYINKYMRICSDHMSEVERFKQKNKWSDIKLIGVHVRRTDMQIKRNQHTLPPRIKDIFNCIDSLLTVEKNAKIFLCTDEQKVLELFKHKYKEKIVFCEEYRSTSEDGTGIHKEKGKYIRKAHKYLLGKEILVDAVLLSQCNKLVCGISNVTNAALLFNNGKYDQVQILR